MSELKQVRIWLNGGAALHTESWQKLAQEQGVELVLVTGEAPDASAESEAERSLREENAELRRRLEALSSSDGCSDLGELERRTVCRVFAEVGGNRELAQRRLGVSRATLYRMIKRYGIEAPGRKAPARVESPVAGPVAALS